MALLYPTILQYKTVIHCQIHSFIKQSRKSGIESKWIDLISGKPVDNESLVQLDSLLNSVLSKPPPRPSKEPWEPTIELKQESITRRTSIHYEIPKAFRENLKKECISLKGDTPAGRELYQERMRQVRYDLFRDGAINSPIDALPPVKPKQFHKSAPKVPDSKKDKAKELVQNLFTQNSTILGASLQFFENVLDVKEHATHPEVSPFHNLYKEYKAVTSQYRKEIESGSISMNVTVPSRFEYVDKNNNPKAFNLEPILKLNTPHSNLLKAYLPYVRALNKAHLPAYYPKESTLMDIPHFKFMVAVVMKGDEYDKLALETHLRMLEQLCYIMDHLRDSILSLAVVKAEDVEDRIPEAKIEIKRRLLESDFSFKPLPKSVIQLDQ